MREVGIGGYRIEEVNTMYDATGDIVAVRVWHERRLIEVSRGESPGRVAKLVAEIATKAAVVSIGALPLLAAMTE